MAEQESHGAATDPVAETEFLLDLAQALHAAQLPSDLADLRLERAARGLGLAAQAFSLQTVVFVHAGGNGGTVALRRMPFNAHWNLSRTRALAQLCRDAAEARLTLVQARVALARILAKPSPYPQGLVIAAYGVYGGAVAARIGGGWRETMVAAAVGVLTGVIHSGPIRHSRADLVKSLLAAFLGTLTVLALASMAGSFDLERALFGGITLLVPAMIVTLGIHELAHEAPESGVVRLAYGLLRFLMIAVGVGAAAHLWRLFAPLAESLAPAPLPGWAVTTALIMAGIALTVCLQGSRRDLLWVVFGTLLAFYAQLLTKHLFGEPGSPFLATFVVGIAAGLQARLPDHVAGTVLVPGFLQLAPGFLGVQSMLLLLRGEAPAEGVSIFNVLLVATQLALGLLAAAACFRGSAAGRAS